MLAATLAAPGLAHAEPEVAPEHRRLRLDESPDLSLLAPFRHASDPGRTVVGRWRRSPFGSWIRRNLHSLDWEAGYADRGRGTEAPINPNVAMGAGDAWAARLTEPEARWPFISPWEHWFEDGPQTSWLAGPLSISAEWMPPWLTRVDMHWAHALILAAGCGRGGSCSPGESFPASVFVSLWDALSPDVPPSPWWECRERPFKLYRFGQEKHEFTVLHCDGSVPESALETLSVVARPPGVARPETFPIQPTGANGEWVAGIRMMHPRLLWVLHRIALAFPWRAAYLYSGYRPADGPLKPGTHASNHAFGRAIDISVQGVDNEELLELCHKLADVGCGYYPNGKFVHFDIRYGGGGLWVDVSRPGEPSRYVANWPGVVENGLFVWKKG